MKSICVLIVLVIALSCKLFSHNWEMGLKVYKSDGVTFEIKHVFLYKSSGKYPYELHDEGWTSLNSVPGAAGLNGVSDYLFCDQTNQDFEYPIWDPIWPGSYVLRIDNKWCYFFVYPPDCEDPISQGSADFIIKYKEGGIFELEQSS